MIDPTEIDPSHGYEAVAREFIAYRTRSTIGAATVREWARALPTGATVLELGCGPGVPISQVLLDGGLTLHAVDASPSMVAAFRSRFPRTMVECAAVQDSRFFNWTFDGVVAWGLLFLLAPSDQMSLIRKVARALNPGGRFLFTAPRQACEWLDEMTGQTSVSLGLDTYRQALESAGLTLAGQEEDKGGNHYYFAEKGGR